MISKAARAAALLGAPTGRRSALARKPPRARMRADHDVLAHGHGAEHRQVLEGAADAELAGDLVRGPAGERAALEQDVAGLVL
jgi:hypothetical protein